MHHNVPHAVNQEYLYRAWTPALPPDNTYIPLQLPSVRDPLSFPGSHVDYTAHSHQYTIRPVFPLPASTFRTEHRNQNFLDRPTSHHLIDVCNSDTRRQPIYSRGIVHPPVPYSHMPQNLTYVKDCPNTLASHCPQPTKRGRRRRSNTVSSIPCHKSSAQEQSADDKLIMLRYYTDKQEPKKKKRMKKACSSGTLEDYIALLREPENPMLVAKFQRRESSMLTGFQRLQQITKQIEHALDRREPVTECAEVHLPVSTDPADYDLDEPPPLVIDLPEEDSAQRPDDCDEVIGGDLSPTDTNTTFQQDEDPPTLINPPSEVFEPLVDDPSQPSYFSIVQKALAPIPVPQSVGRSTTCIPSIVKGGKFQCKRCEQFFPTINQLLKHRLYCKTRPEPHQYLTCTQCDMTFSSSKACADHWKEYHSTERPHQCPKCGRRFTLIRALEKHSWIHK